MALQDKVDSSNSNDIRITLPTHALHCTAKPARLQELVSLPLKSERPPPPAIPEVNKDQAATLMVANPTKTSNPSKGLLNQPLRRS